MSKKFEYSKEATVGDWKCVTQQEPWNDIVSVYLIKYDGAKHVSVASIVDGQLKLEEAKGEQAKPLMRLPYFAWESILEVLGSIVPDAQEMETTSELKATKYHLEDLRKLVFKIK